MFEYIDWRDIPDQPPIRADWETEGDFQFALALFEQGFDVDEFDVGE